MTSPPTSTHPSSPSYPPYTAASRPSHPSLRLPNLPSIKIPLPSSKPTFAHHDTHGYLHKNPPVPTPGADAAAQKKRRRKRRRSRISQFFSVLYHASFYVLILIIGCLLLGAAYGLGEQAWRTGDQRRWNIVVLVGAYVALALISILHIWARILSVKKILLTMPKPYMPIKNIDIPKKVADHIMTEYSRTAIIAHISQATTGQQEGWGRPDTKWENQHFRSYILNTYPSLRSTLAPRSKAPPHSLEPLYGAADKLDDKGALRLFVNSYGKMYDKARFARREPTEVDASAVEKIVEVVSLTMEMKKRRDKDKASAAERRPSD